MPKKGLCVWERRLRNTFLVTKLRHVMKVLHRAGVNIQNFQRIFTLFVWFWVWAQNTGRNNRFRSVKAGGLGCTQLFLSQIVSRFPFLRVKKHISENCPVNKVG